MPRHDSELLSLSMCPRVSIFGESQHRPWPASCEACSSEKEKGGLGLHGLGSGSDAGRAFRLPVERSRTGRPWEVSGIGTKPAI